MIVDGAFHADFTTNGLVFRENMRYHGFTGDINRDTLHDKKYRVTDRDNHGMSICSMPH